MALRRIASIGDSVLRKQTRIVVKFNGRLHQLLDDMASTMYDANGCGLAAPQVGILMRAIVIDLGGEENRLIELLNPEIQNMEGEEEGIEGCLSIPGKNGYVIRPSSIQIRAQDRYGEYFEMDACGMLARCICHEIDHLHGRLYTDIMIREAPIDEKEDVMQNDKNAED